MQLAPRVRTDTSVFLYESWNQASFEVMVSRKIWGTLACMVVAGVVGFVFHSTRFRDIVPFLFIPVIGLVAARFGTWSGIVGTIGSVLIFAEFLFAPVYSLRVTNSAQRNNLSLDGHRRIHTVRGLLWICMISRDCQSVSRFTHSSSAGQLSNCGSVTSSIRL
jgi:hypothetical protein